MEVFRLSQVKYSKGLNASGKAARWNKDNEFVLYTGQSRSLVTLESVVHANSIKTKLQYEIMVVSIADDKKLYKEKRVQDLPKHWQKTAAYAELQAMGSAWYLNNESLVLKVPSAIIPQEFNYIINIRHPDFAQNVSLIGQEEYFWDNRLLTYNQ